MITGQGSGRYGMVPACAYDDKLMNATLRDVLGVICTYSNRKHDGWCEIRQGVIAQRLGIKRETVTRAVPRLVELGYIQSRRTYRKDGGKAPNFYRVDLMYDLPRERYRCPPPEEDEPLAPCDPTITYPPPHVIQPGHIHVIQPDHIHVIQPDHISIGRTDVLTDKRTEDASPLPKNPEPPDWPPPEPEPAAPSWGELTRWGMTPEGREWLEKTQDKANSRMVTGRKLLRAWSEMQADRRFNASQEAWIAEQYKRTATAATG